MPTSLPLEVFGAAINVICLMVAMVFSAAIALYHHQPYFRHWTWSYVAGTIAVGLLAISDQVSRPVGLTSLIAALYYLHAHLIAVSAYSLENRPAPRAYRVLSYGLGVAVPLLLLAGSPFELTIAALAALNVYTHAVLGLALARYPSPGPRGPRMTTSALVAGIGVWSFGYTGLQPFGLVWAGYIVAGLLHLLVGMGMVVFLLEQAAEQLRSQNEELKAVDRLKTNFIATVSHELRTPLTVIKGSTSLLHDEVLGAVNDAQRQQLAVVEANTEALIGQINDLLDFSRLDAGMMEFKKEPGDVNATARAAAERFGALIAARDQRLDVELADGPLMATVDHGRLQQVIGNLLSNAAKFAPEGSRVTLRLRREGHQVRLEVQDDGPGLPPAELERIFTRFYQIDGGDTRKVRGSGLGLAICRSIVEEGHGGRMWAENVPAQGTLFVATLPAPAPAEASPVLSTPGTHP